MGQFLRFALLIILVFIGFGTGICGLWAVVGSVIDLSSSRPDQFAGAFAVVGLICIVVAVACFFGVRALARSLRTHGAATPSVPPPPPPAAPPPTPPA